MPDLSVTADEPCEHHYKTHILGGHPLHVAICTLCRAIDWAELAEQAAELRKPLENRLRLAHQARRAKEHQLDDVRRALCDVGVIADDDPYGHADLAGVIRQWGDELTDEEARELADQLGRDLYRAEDALAFVGECCDIADRRHQAVTTGDVREWLKGARCGRQMAADAAQTAKPGPEAGTCTATAGGVLGDRVHCSRPAGHYDPARKPIPHDDPCAVGDPGGWHRGISHGCTLTWSDDEPDAAPHRDAVQTGGGVREDIASRQRDGWMSRALVAEAAGDRVRRLAEQWQATMPPGEPHPAARAVLAALDGQGSLR